MRAMILEWLGLGPAGPSFAWHGHTRGVIASMISTPSHDTWATMRSFVLSSAAERVVVALSHSLALPADTSRVTEPKGHGAP